MKRWVKIVGFLGSIALVGLAVWRGSAVPFKDQWPLYEALRNTAAIIFAVIGAWLAIVYPERLKMSLRGSAESKSNENGQRVVSLMTPIVNSTVILAAILLIGVSVPLVKGLPFVQAHVEVFRGISYGILTALTFWQLWTVILTLIPASDVTNSVRREQAVRQTVRNVISQTRSPPKSSNEK